MTVTHETRVSVDRRARPVDLPALLDRYQYPEAVRQIIADEQLLPIELLNRLQALYPAESGLTESEPLFFEPGRRYAGVSGFREVVAVLARHGVELGHLAERELFIEVYRFMATSHVLNAINWRAFAGDSLFQLTFPQPGMMPADVTAAYLGATTPDQRAAIVAAYHARTNPHDGKQLLNRPWIDLDDGSREVIVGSQHKYPQCQLIFDRTTQNCLAFCTYCFRHAQVRQDEDMFVQDDVAQVHRYLRVHPEVTDILITGGDASDPVGSVVVPRADDPYRIAGVVLPS